MYIADLLSFVMFFFFSDLWRTRKMFRVGQIKGLDDSFECQLEVPLFILLGAPSFHLAEDSILLCHLYPHERIWRGFMHKDSEVSHALASVHNANLAKKVIWGLLFCQLGRVFCTTQMPLEFCDSVGSSQLFAAVLWWILHQCDCQTCHALGAVCEIARH